MYISLFKKSSIESNIIACFNKAAFDEKVLKKGLISSTCSYDTGVFDEYIEYMDVQYVVNKYYLNNDFLIKYKNVIDFKHIIGSPNFISSALIEAYYDKIDESDWKMLASSSQKMKVSSVVYSKYIKNFDQLSLYRNGILSFEFIRDNIDNIDSNVLARFIYDSEFRDVMFNAFKHRINLSEMNETNIYYYAPPHELVLELMAHNE